MSNTLEATLRPGSRPELSPRETEVLRAWLTSASKEEAARTLYLAPSTVTTHITRIRAKYATLGRPTGCKARLLAAALRDGYIDLDDFDRPVAERPTPRPRS